MQTCLSWALTHHPLVCAAKEEEEEVVVVVVVAMVVMVMEEVEKEEEKKEEEEAAPYLESGRCPCFWRTSIMTDCIFAGIRACFLCKVGGF